MNDAVVMTAVKISLTTLVVHASVLEVRWAAGDITGLSNYHTGLEIRVVLWPQSTKTSVGPPDISTWWSGGLLKTLIIKKQYFYNIY